jgi:hypothetical protein
MDQPIGKWRVREKEREGVGADFMSKNIKFYKIYDALATPCQR